MKLLSALALAVLFAFSSVASAEEVYFTKAFRAYGIHVPPKGRFLKPIYKANLLKEVGISGGLFGTMKGAFLIYQRTTLIWDSREHPEACEDRAGIGQFICFPNIAADGYLRVKYLPGPVPRFRFYSYRYDKNS